MSEETTQVDATAQPELDVQNTDPKPDVKDQPQATNQQSIDELLKELKDTRKEAANYRTKNKEITTQYEQLKAQFDEKDTENLTLKSSIKEAKITSAFSKAAIEAGAVDIDAAYKLADLSGLELDDTGAPKAESVVKIIEELKTSKSYLFKINTTPNIDAATNGKAVAEIDLNTCTPQEAADYYRSINKKSQRN